MKKTFVFLLNILFLTEIGCICSIKHPELSQKDNTEAQQSLSVPVSEFKSGIDNQIENKKDGSATGVVPAVNTVIAESVNIEYFAFDSFTLTKAAKENIEYLSKVIKDNGYYGILLQGHADSIGTREYNQKLSIRRANAAKAEFVKNGVDVSKIEVIGYGEDKPIADNNTAEGRAKNRRIIIFIEQMENKNTATV